MNKIIKYLFLKRKVYTITILFQKTIKNDINK